MKDRREDQELRRLQAVKTSTEAPALPLGAEMVSFFKNSVARRQSRLGKIAEVWTRLIPVILAEHCALESYSRGSLTVIVDSSSHLYDLKQLLLAGLEKQLLMACSSAGLRKIILRPGRWYDGENPAESRPLFAESPASPAGGAARTRGPDRRSTPPH